MWMISTKCLLFNREPCQGTQYWRAAYVMVDLVMQWLDLVISMEIDMKVCCDRYQVLLLTFTRILFIH